MSFSLPGIKRYIGAFLLAFLLSAFPAERAWAIPLHKEVLKSTVYIKNAGGEIGAGFLLSKEFEKIGKHIFLITNRHVLTDRKDRTITPRIDVRFYRKDNASGGEKTKIVSIPVFSEGGLLFDRVFFHPDAEVDMAALLLSDLVGDHPDVDFIALPESSILGREDLVAEVIDAGEDVVILGYPANIFSESNFLPLVKSGMIASSTTEDIELHLSDRLVTGRIFLVEASLFGGNSGGPVLVKPRWRTAKDPATLKQTVMLGEMLPLSLLGVSSSSIRIPDRVYVEHYRGRMTVGSGAGRERDTDARKAQRPGKEHVERYVVEEKDVMLNLVYSSQYLDDIFDLVLKRVPEAPEEPST